MANGWTPDRKARQAELIRNWRPWERSTGPKTAAGKLAVSMNGYRGGVREQARTLARLIRSALEGHRDALARTEARGAADGIDEVAD
jgi:hypothetical protein